MSRFIESMALREGKLKLLEYHQERFERTRREIFGLRKHPMLEELIEIPAGLEKGSYKCRVRYGRKIELIELEPYRQREIHSLKLIQADTIDYPYKYADRSRLEELFRQRGPCDDILMFQNDLLTDSYIANTVFRSNNAWFTPLKPLLPGTMRSYLLKSGQITEASIHTHDLEEFDAIRLINALNPLAEAPEIPMESVHR